jgi:hypothetical protein
MSDTSRFVIWVHRTPDSLFGAASNPVIRNGALLSFDEEDCARAECDRLNAHLSNPHIHYTVQLADARRLEAVCSADWANARVAHVDARP